MKKNMGSIDRVVRALIAITFITLYLTGIIPGTIGLVLIAVSVIFLLTSLLSFCPIYAIFGWRTCPISKVEG